MAKVNVNDRGSLERAYPAEAFAADAAQNERVASPVLRGVRVGSAPDKDGWFELERAARHAGEPETPYFLAPVLRAEEPQPVATPEPSRGYGQFLDDLIAAAKRYGFRVEDAPGPGDARLRGLRQ